MGYGSFDNGSKYVGAPYNFVPFSKTVYEYPRENWPKHNDVSEELLTGEICYTIKAETPVMIGSGEKRDGVETFYRDNYGRFAIPGSSFRGLIKSNVQVLSMSSFADDIDDYALMYRNVAGGKEKEKYNTILGAKQMVVGSGEKKQQFSVLLNVKAGYIRNEGGKYVIFPTELERVDKDHGKMNYYVLSERTMAEDLQRSMETGSTFNYPLFYKNGRSITQHLLDKGFYKEVNKGRVHYKGTANKFYKPYALSCSYEVSGRKITAVGEPHRFHREGFAVSTGKMNEKKAIYIIPEARYDDGDKIVIPDVDVKAFQVDFNKKKNSLKSFGDPRSFDLPGEGEEKPVFYIYEEGHLYFGFTPRLRLFYSHTIVDGIPGSHIRKCDYAQALFGYSNGDDSFKSRLSFADAVTDGGKGTAVYHAIQGEPKASSFLDYVEPDENGKGMSYNDDGFRLRGIKQYWLRKNASVTVPQEKLGEDYVTTFMPLDAGTVFTGKIRFANVKPEELGLLLWAMKPEEGSQMNIGKGKAFGFGRISVGIDALNILDTAGAYKAGTLSLTPFTTDDAGKYIAIYLDSMRGKAGGRNPEDLRSVKVLKGMKAPEKMPDESRIRYMDINAREYQSRTVPLQMPEELMKGGRYVKEADSVQAEARPEISRQPEKVLMEPEAGKTYKAVVKDIQGKYVKFEIPGYGFGRFSCENVEYSSIGKKELKNEFPEKQAVEVCWSEHGEDGKPIWKCTAKL